MLPGADGVFVEPPPYRLVTYGGNQPGGTNLPCDVRSAPSGQWNATGCRQFTGQSPDLHHHFWGKKLGVVPSGLDRRVPPGVCRQSVCARNRQLRVGYPVVWRSHCCPIPLPPGERSLRAEPGNTLTYISLLCVAALLFLHLKGLSCMGFFLAYLHHLLGANMPSFDRNINQIIR